MDVSRADWRKSSYSSANGGNCVEVAALNGVTWRKSSYSSANGGACVEVARDLPGVVAVRDSKDPSGPALAFSPDSWRSFADKIKAGTLSLP